MIKTMSVFRLGIRGAAIMTVVPLAACFSYSTVPLEDIVPDQTARLTLTQDGYGRVVNEAAVAGFPVQLMNLSGNRISGRVAGVSSDSLTVQLRGAGASVLSTQVASSAIQEVAIRQFNRINTIGAVAATVGAAVLLTQGGVIPGGAQGTGDDDPQNMIGLRLFSVSVP